ncbi:MAG: hypothetical protein ACPGUC_10870, partial [Gammaproteobacteria bacterium]
MKDDDCEQPQVTERSADATGSPARAADVPLTARSPREALHKLRYRLDQLADYIFPRTDLSPFDLEGNRRLSIKLVESAAGELR